jgi:predicted nucleic acid-binding protein
MTGRVFFDTNVLVYGFDEDEPLKRAAAAARLRNTPLEQQVFSTQVLQEFYNTVTRKLRRPVPAEAAEASVRILARLNVVPTTAPLVLDAIALHRAHHLSLWDALIVQAALSAGCERLLTEDLPHGRKFGGLTVENPFLG